MVEYENQSKLKVSDWVVVVIALAALIILATVIVAVKDYLFLY